jgi:pimeloyl-ACP methyl ester carboxylesterase
MLSTTGAPGVGVPERSTVEALVELGRDIADPVEREVATGTRFASPGFALDEGRVRARMRRHVARGEPEGGSERQLAAILCSDDRTAMLASLTVPTLVVHGDADPLVPLDGGAATAAAIPGARFMVISGLAHELPPQTWPEVVAAIVALARGADARRDRRPPSTG